MKRGEVWWVAFDPADWNLLGDGQHEIVALMAGDKVGWVTVTVTTVDGEFVRDVTGECVVRDFPRPGHTVTLE